MLSAPAARAADTMDPQLREKARRAVDAGLNYLRSQQAEDGSVAKSVGITALSLRAFLESHRGYNEGDGPFITKQVDFLLSKVNADGSISESLQNRSYNTAVALNALTATKNPKYEPVVSGGRKFLTGHQIDEGEGYKRGASLLRRGRLRRRRAARHVEPVPRARRPQGRLDRPEGPGVAEGARVRESFAEPQ